jgi:purine-binding chemotaxis protein CheW
MLLRRIQRSPPKGNIMVEPSTSDSPRSAWPTEKRNSSQFVGFQIDEQHYAFRIEQIQEIVILDRVTQTPQVADYVEGVSNLRGVIIPIINLRKLLGLDPQPTDGDTRTIVVNVGQRIMGCTVDMVSHVIRIPEENIQPAPENLAADEGNYVAGFANVDDGLVILLDIDELLNPDRLRQISHAINT